MAYSATKGALSTFTKNVANALRVDQIRVNGINLGWTDTPAEDTVQRKMGRPENWLEIAEQASPFGRLLKPMDVARLCAYLFLDGLFPACDGIHRTPASANGRRGELGQQCLDWLSLVSDREWTTVGRVDRLVD